MEVGPETGDPTLPHCAAGPIQAVRHLEVVELLDPLDVLA